MVHTIHALAEDIRRQVKKHRELRRKRTQTRRRLVARMRGPPPSRSGRRPPMIGPRLATLGNASARDMVTRALRVGEGRKFKGYEKRAEAINRIEPEMELLDDAELREEADDLRERATRRRVARRPAAGGLRPDPRGRAPLDRPAPLRRAADRRHGPARGRDRRDEDGRGQDPDRDARRLPQHAGRRQRPRRHRQRLPRPPRRRMDDSRSTTCSASASPRSRRTTTTTTRQRKYACDVTYGTNSEFGFDYLRDNMADALEHCVQRGHHFAIVDEVDNILIDEARTPLIISGAPEQAAQTYYTFARLAKQMDGVPGERRSCARWASRRTPPRPTTTTNSTRSTRPSRRPRRASNGPRSSSASTTSTSASTAASSTTWSRR